MAVVALVAYIAVERRLGWLAGVLVTYHVVEMVLIHGLSQREHLVGVLVGTVAAPLRAGLTRWWRAREQVIAPFMLRPRGTLAPAIVPRRPMRLDR